MQCSGRTAEVIVSTLPLPRGLRVKRHTTHKRHHYSFLVVTALHALSVAYQVFEDCISNCLAAVLERCVYHKLPGASTYTLPTFPTAAQFNQSLKTITQLLCHHATYLPWSFDEFIRQTRPVKKMVYKAAAESLQTTPVCKHDSDVKGFEKYEKLPVESKRTVPRLIQPRDPRLNLEIGCYLKRIERRVYKDLAKIFGSGQRVVIAKGLNAYETAALIKEDWYGLNRPVAFGLDASRFDSHCHRAALAWTHHVFESYFSGDERRRLHRLLRYQLDTHVTVNAPDGHISFDHSTRCSGEMDTALGNCLLSAAMLRAYCDTCGIPTTAYMPLINGDDVVVIIDRKYADAFAKNLINHYLTCFGFVMKVTAPVCELEHIAFCQCHPVFDGSDWRMVRGFPASLTKDSTIIHPIFNDEYLRRYLRTLGECGLALTCGIPVLQEYYRALMSASSRGGIDLGTSGMSFLARGLHGRVKPVTPEARASFAMAFGCMPAHQRALEERLRELDLSHIRRGRDECVMLAV